jgi:hypothetical protein
MKPKMLILLLVVAVVAVTVSTAKAQLDPSIVVRDTDDNILNGGIVNLNTAVIAYCDYVDPAHPSTTGYIDVFLDQGSGFIHLGNLWTGPVNSGQTIQSPQYTLSQMGTYKFAWTVQAGDPAGDPCPETAQVSTTLRLAVPEPGTIAALAMALSAFGFLAVKKRRAK